MTSNSRGSIDAFRRRLRQELGLEGSQSDDGETDNVERLAQVVRCYFSNGYTGAKFDTFGANDSKRITSDDLIALSLLSIHIREKSTSSLRPSSILTLESLGGRIAKLLAAIPDDCELHTLSSDEFDRWLGPDSKGDELYWLLRNDASIPRVAVYKLLARKRLMLMPIRDTVVERALGRSRGEWWRPWWATLSADPELVEHLGRVRQKSGAAHLSLLRIADIIVWMRHQPSGNA